MELHNETTQVTPSATPVRVPLMPLQKEFFEGLKVLGRSANTVKNYRTDLECFNTYLREKLNSVNIDDFDIPKVMEYGKYLENRYSSDNSRRRRVQALRIFFDFLVEKGYFSNNPVRKLPTSPKFLDIPRPTPFTDVKTLWVYLNEEEKSTKTSKMGKLLAKRNQVVMLLIYGSALKVSDLANLKNEHLFLDEETPRVLITNTRRDPYSVPLLKIFPKVFAEYQMLLEEMKKFSEIDFDDVLFNANPYRILSGGLSPRGLEVIFEEFRKKLMLQVTPKSLRQSAIFKWLHEKHPDNVLKEWLGVAPSYSLKLYKSHMEKHMFTDEFIEEIHTHYLTQNTSAQVMH